MNFQYFRQNVGKIIRFRPRPKTDQSHYMLEELNQWTILDTDDTGARFQNTITDHEIYLAKDSIREFREPDWVVLRGQIYAGDAGKTSFELLTKGIDDRGSASALSEPLNSDQVKEMLGESIMLANDIIRLNRHELVHEWLRFCYELIESAFGAGESALFMSDAGYVSYGGGRTAARDVLDCRLRRLSELIPRITGLRVNEQLNVEEMKRRLQKLRERVKTP